MDSDRTVLDLTAEIVAAFVSNNHVNASGLTALIAEVHGALIRSSAGEPVAAESVPQKPAVPIRKSVTPDFIVCLEDGKQFKSMRRHVSQHGMTPAEYRTKWGLPKDYPMVAPNYAQQRSEMALKLGLGRKPVPAPETSAETTTPKRRTKKQVSVE